MIKSKIKRLYFKYLLFLDERRLLTLVPKGHKKNARILLKEFDERGNELTWNSGFTYLIAKY